MTVVLHVRNATKYFGGVTALDSVSIDVQQGEIHALLGQNGSGKSTLMKCLSGFYSPEPGWKIEVNGEVRSRPLHVGEFRELGMSFVHQDLGLIPEVSVLENLRLGDFAAQRMYAIRWARERQWATNLLREFAVDVNPSLLVERLRPVERAMVAIVRAVHELRSWQIRTGRGGGLLLLDEATALLDRTGKQSIAQLLERVRETGAGVLWVSHDLNEVLTSANRVTVLRDGRRVATLTQVELGRTSGVDHVVEHMTGTKVRAREQLVRRTVDAIIEKENLSVEGLTGGLVHDFSTRFHAGEVLGITGLVGAGWEDVPVLLFGARTADAGTLNLGQRHLDLRTLTPRHAMAEGLGLVPSDRQHEGVVGELLVRANVSLPVASAFMRHGILSITAERSAVLKIMQRHGVVPESPELPINALSGGNQQKVVLGKWLNLKPRLLLLQDPTQGVDVAARQKIHEAVRSAAAAGMAVLYATADYEELAQVVDRVLIMGDGRIIDELGPEEITEEAIAAAALRAHGHIEREGTQAS